MGSRLSADTDPECLLGDAVLHTLQHIHVGMWRGVKENGGGDSSSAPEIKGHSPAGGFRGKGLASGCPYPRVWTPAGTPPRVHWARVHAGGPACTLCCPQGKGWRAETTPGPSTYMPEGSGHSVHPPHPRAWQAGAPEGTPSSHPQHHVPRVAGPRRQPECGCNSARSCRVLGPSCRAEACPRPPPTTPPVLRAQNAGPAAPRPLGPCVPGRAHLSLRLACGGRGWCGFISATLSAQLCPLRPPPASGIGRRGWPWPGAGVGGAASGRKDIVAEADDVVELQRHVLLVRDAHLVHECLRGDRLSEGAGPAGGNPFLPTWAGTALWHMGTSRETTGRTDTTAGERSKGQALPGAQGRDQLPTPGHLSLGADSLVHTDSCWPGAPARPHGALRSSDTHTRGGPMARLVRPCQAV